MAASLALAPPLAAPPAPVAVRLPSPFGAGVQADAAVAAAAEEAAAAAAASEAVGSVYDARRLALSRFAPPAGAERATFSRGTVGAAAGAAAGRLPLAEGDGSMLHPAVTAAGAAAAGEARMQAAGGGAAAASTHYSPSPSSPAGRFSPPSRVPQRQQNVASRRCPSTEHSGHTRVLAARRLASVSSMVTMPVGMAMML